MYCDFHETRPDSLTCWWADVFTGYNVDTNVQITNSTNFDIQIYTENYLNTQIWRSPIQKTRKCWLSIIMQFALCAARLPDLVRNSFLLHRISNEMVANVYLWHDISQGGRSCTGARVAPAERFGLGRKFKPKHTLFCCELRFVAIYALLGDLWVKKCPSTGLVFCCFGLLGTIELNLRFCTFISTSFQGNRLLFRW